MKKIFFYLLISCLPSCLLQAADESPSIKIPSVSSSTMIPVDAISPPEWDRKIGAVQANIASFFEKTQEDYEKSMKELNSEKLDIAISNLQVADSTHFLTTVQEYINKNGDTKQKRIFSKINDYEAAKKELDNKIKELHDEITTQGLINTQTETEKNRKKYYQKIKKELSFLQKIEQSDYIEPNRNNVSQKVVKKLTEGLEQETKEIKQNIEKNQWTNHTLPKFNRYQCCLVGIKDNLKEIPELEPKKRLNEFENAVEEKVNKIVEKNKNATYQETAKNIIKIKEISNHLESRQKDLNKRIDEALQTFKRENKKDPKALGMLSNYLEKNETGIGQNIIDEHAVLKGEKQKIFAQKMKSHGIDHILNEIQPSGIDTNLLNKLYKKFREKYEELLLSALNGDQSNELDLKGIIANAYSFAGTNKQISRKNIKWDGNMRKNKVPILLAYIFAVWTLQASNYYLESNQKSKTGLSDYLRQPHAAQIICIFRLLGVDEKNHKNKLPNNFAQVGTGEGKSLIAAGTACVLSLLGFNHKSACYSSHLVQRDFNNFKDLFNAFGVFSHIQYDTFHNLCEQMINRDVNVRKTVANLILGKDNDDEKKNEDDEKESETKHHSLEQLHTILFVDEVDVFINSLYGKYYTPVSRIQSPEIEELIRYIWSQRGAISLSQLTISSQYSTCCDKLSDWKPLIKEACKDIIHAFSSAKDLEKNKDYIVKNDQIGYKDEDTISFNIHYGYTTLRNYFFENEQKNISDQSLNKNIALYVKCGTFSFAEVIKEYSRIVGVTGTLEALSSKQKEIVENVYGVKKNTYMPSLYGKNKFAFYKKQDITIVPRKEHYQALIREINQRMIGKVRTEENSSENDDEKKEEESYTQEVEKRAVLVVFENSKLLNRFYHSDEFLAYQSATQRMTEELNFQERENRVRQATRSGKITLLVKSFARGVDFVCHDIIVNKNGGPHLIMTFVSEEYAEEVQAHGRVARQSGPGSASWVLCEEDLEKFGIKDKTEIQSMIENKTCYEVIHEKRNEFFDLKYEDEIQHVAQLAEEHNKALELRDALKSKNKEKALEHLCNYNLGTSEAKKARGVVAIDATGSMSGSLRKAQNTVVKAFENTREILKDKKKPVDCFEIQFAFYRNYGDYEDKLLEHSSWTTNPQNLRTYIQGVPASGGYGVNEAVEVGLEHVLREQEKSIVSFVLLIGDAPPNTESEIITKRQYRGEAYWKGTSFFKNVQHVDKLLPKFKEKGIHVHAFHTDEYARPDFEKIASQTGGSAGLFQADSSSGTQQLTGILSQAVLKAIGGADLVSAYVKRFGGKTYV